MQAAKQAVKLKRGGMVPAPLGTIVIRTDRVAHQDGRRGAPRKVQSLMIKIRMDGKNGLRWTSYARWWWEKERGPIPPGKMVLHRNGDPLDCDPENLFLGGPGDKIRLAHALDPEMSRSNRLSRSAGTVRHNKLSARIRGALTPLSRYWYPVMDAPMVIANLYHRSRRKLLGLLGASPEALARLPKNGRGKLYHEAAESVEVRLVRGRDLKTGLLGCYIRVDPESEVSLGGGRVEMGSRKMQDFLKTPLWGKIKAAALELELSVKM